MDELLKALYFAAVKGNIQDVTNIITHNDIPVNECLIDVLKLPYGSRKFYDPTALTVAAEYGHIDLVKKLLELGIEYYAVGKKEFEYKGIPDRFVSVDYFGAMVIAAGKDRCDIVQVLAEFRLHEYISVDHPYLEIVEAARENNLHKLEAYFNDVENKSVSLKGWKGHNIMNLFILHRCSLSCLQLMIDNGIEVNGWDSNGLTPLRCAILSGKLETVQFLLEKGALVYAPQLHGDTHFKYDGTFVCYRGGEFTPKTSNQKLYLYREFPTALMYAASLRNVPILTLMLKSAPKHIGICSTEHIFGDTPLNYAICYGNFMSVSLILKYKTARLNIGRGGTIDVAVSLEDKELFELLLRNATQCTSFEIYLTTRHCIREKKPLYLTRLLKSFEKLVRKRDNGGSLFCAIDSDSFECAHILFKVSGFNINAKYKENGYLGITALMHACRKGKDEFVRLFLKMGAKVDIKDNTGRTAINYAAKAENSTCLELMMDITANLEQSDKTGGTVFSVAMFGNGCCLETLLKSGRLFETKILKLKQVHIKALVAFGASSAFPIPSLMLLMQYDVFDWSWCPVLSKSLHNIVFAAVTLGITPVKFKYRDSYISVLILAIVWKDEATIRYLMANLYFLPSDYQYLSGNSIVNNFALALDDSKIGNLIGRLLFQPLSLLQWSCLTISNAVTSCSLSFNKTCDSVDTLPIPVKLRRELKFKKNYSQLCYRHWKDLGSPTFEDNVEFDDLVIDGNVLRDETLKSCTKRGCACGGLGLTFDQKKHINNEN